MPRTTVSGVAHVSTPRCPHCRHFLFLDKLICPECDGQLAYHPRLRQFVGIHRGKTVVGGETWYTCSNRGWRCNWLVRDDAPSGRCFSCRLTRATPDGDDTVALEKLAKTEEAKRRLVLQLGDLGLPIRPWYEGAGGLGFDFLSSISLGRSVTIGHKNGIITLDLAESLDDRREALRIKLGEPYRTMLGHLRHEVGHYYQRVLITDEQTWAECRALFGDERANYRDAVARHYREGAPEGWAQAYISEYATMHPWEDFAETFAHYLHITATLQTANATGMRLDGEAFAHRDSDVNPLPSYADQPVHRLVGDWRWMSHAFNRVNRSMGMGDLYPFEIVATVVRKLAFIHDIVTRSPQAAAEQQVVALAAATAAATTSDTRLRLTDVGAERLGSEPA